MSLKQKIWLVLSGVMLIMLATFALIDKREIGIENRAEMHRQAIELRAVLMATRRIYQQQFLASGVSLNEHTIGLLPAHALSRIAADYHNWTESRLKFNNVSDRPRNPTNQADTDELAAMAWHRQNPQKKDRLVDIRRQDGHDYLLYTAPIWIESSCLPCHSSPEIAPPSIRKYSSDAFGYHLGDLRGVLSIKIPSTEVHARAMARWRGEWLEKTGMLLTLLLGIGLLLNRLVLARLEKLQAAVQRIMQGDYHVRIAPTGNDELDALGHSFDNMATAVLQRDRALADSQAQNRVLVELAPVGMFRTDAAGKCIYVNERWQQIAEMDLSAALDFGWTRVLHPADRQRVADEWRACTRNKQPFHSEYRFLSSTGAVTWLLGQARAETGPDGEVIGYIGSVTDISARKRAEELEHYGAFQAGIAEMSTSVLHNIGNAITSVTQDAEVLARATGELQRVAELLAQSANQVREELQSTPENAAQLAARQSSVQIEAARVIADLGRTTLQARSKHMAAGVNHIADIVRIQQNAARPGGQTSSFSLSEAIRSALALQGDRLEKDGIHVSVDVAQTLDLVTLSHNRLLQALINAIKNSIEAIHERRQREPVEGSISIRAEAMDSGGLRLTLADNGAGFTPETLANLFHFGYSTKQRGSGFGLHATAVFMQEAGGRVELTSDGPDQGALLSLEFPRHAQESRP